MTAQNLEQALAASLDYVREAKRQRGEDIDEWLAAAPVPPKRLKRKKMSSNALAVAEEKPTQLARVVDDQGMSVETLKFRVSKVREVQRSIMVEGKHFGKVPGTKDKDCLFKPGAELLGLAFQLGPDFKIEERWEGEHLEAVVTCTLIQTTSGARMGSGIGSCSTREKKYAWRPGGKKCPECGKEGSLLKSKDKPEWFCWRKKDGCGKTFGLKDPAIVSQSSDGRVPNPDIADTYNTVRKMACKRAHVAAILFVTCASEIFTQDVEDSDERDAGPGIDPHQTPGQEWDPEATSALGDEITSKLEKVKAAIARVDTYDKALALRAIIGSRAKQSELMAKRQSGEEANHISPSQARGIDKLWQHCDRQVTKLEERLKPALESTFIDEPDGTEALGAPEREPGEDSE